MLTITLSTKLTKKNNKRKSSSDDDYKSSKNFKIDKIHKEDKSTQDVHNDMLTMGWDHVGDAFNIIM